MLAILLSIQPQYVDKIISGKKTIEVRKSRPNTGTPFKCYIYETKGKKQYWSQPLPIPYFEGKGKVIGEFICDKIDKIPYLWEFPELGYDLDDDQQEETCLTRKETEEYGKRKPLYGWHISDLKIYDKPRGLSEFRKLGKEYHDIRENEKGHLIFSDGYIKGEPLNRPPQSWCYVEKL